jgi:hypothetical protein
MKRALRLTGFSEMAAVVTVTTAMAAMMVTIELALPAWAYGAGPHVHGVATLEIAVDGSAVQVNLNSPLDNLLGFEHMPRNEKERQAIKTMASKLRQAGSLFIFTPAAQCRLESTRLESPLLPSELLMAHDKGDKSKSDKSQVPSPAPSAPATSSNTHADDHAELEATWNFRCATPQALQELDVRLFDTFPGLRRLDAMIAGPQGQSGAKLSPASTRLKW